VVRDFVALADVVGVEAGAALARALLHDLGQFVDPLGVGAQQRLVLAPGDLVDEGSIDGPDCGAPGLPGQQRHLAHDCATAQRVDVQVRAVRAPQHDLDIAVCDDEQRRAQVALDHESLAGAERERPRGARQGPKLLGRRKIGTEASSSRASSSGGSSAAAASETSSRPR
jgi:hypothetical protein